MSRPPVSPAFPVKNEPVKIEKVTVYCASSTMIDAAYHDAARELGRLFAEASITVVYGGGAVGSMGHLADGALGAGGRVEGVIPRFMEELEWGHERIEKLFIVENMHQRKAMMLERSDAVVAMPGGTGTFEELFEAITLKRLGIYLKPIVLLDVNGYFAPCIELLERCVEERFMNREHLAMWQVVDRPEDVIAAIREAPPWDESARDFAGAR